MDFQSLQTVQQGDETQYARGVDVSVFTLFFLICQKRVEFGGEGCALFSLTAKDTWGNKIVISKPFFICFLFFWGEREIGQSLFMSRH